MCRESFPFAKHPKTSGRFSGKPSSTGGKQLLRTTGLISLRENLALQWVPERATELTTYARKKDRVSYNELTRKKWVGWCRQQEIDPHKCLVTYILEDLEYLAEMKFKPSTLNSHRSGISACHENVNCKPIGQ